jgi:hypothetical protein
MLEHPSLLIVPGKADAGRASIVDPFSTVALGSVRCRAAGPLAWLCWWSRTTLAVHESDDEPLLLTMRQRLGSWLVRDAEEHPVGRIHGRHLFDAFHQPLAELHREEGTGISQYRDGEQELAIVMREEEGLRVTFQPGPRDNPFVKMVLLAAVLVHNWKALSGAERGRRFAAPES